MIRAALVLCLLAALSGCAGISTYSIKPFFDQDLQKMVCCAVLITSGKDISSVTVDAVKTGDDYTIHIHESGVGATAPVTAQGAVVSNVANAVSNAAISAAKLIK